MIDAKKVLKERALLPNKALGQNFLISEAAINTILNAAQLKGKNVLEIGPGLGTLTEYLCREAGSVLAVEIDKNMIEVLKSTLHSYSNINVLHRDFLDMSFKELSDLMPCPIVIAANLPYYVTTPICLRLVKWDADILNMVLMVQKEAAERFFARPGDRVYGRLSVLMQVRFEISSLLSLPPCCYYPQPTVDSEVVHMKRRTDTEFLPGFFEFVTAAFSSRRKRLTNNLASYGKENILNALEFCKISLFARAEELSPDQFYKFFKYASGIENKY
ncbi:MAG: ribosomal RNA small subunit methyltransferase A [Clostridia bacterium]|nr:ribosomal RNA small subunit methyltransferase A [Clostridia bacterium]